MNHIQEFLDKSKRRQRSKYRGLLTRSEMIDYITQFMYQCIEANDWNYNKCCDVFHLEEMWELDDYDQQQLEGLMYFIDRGFDPDGTYNPPKPLQILK
jgi:hypothetical protein